MSSLRFEQSAHRKERMRNKQKHINVTVANQFTVQKTSYEKFFFKEMERGKHRIQKRCFPNISPLSKSLGPCCSTKKGQSSKSNFDNNAHKFSRKFEAFDFNEQTQRTVKDQNIWWQFLQSPQTLQWAHLGRAS